MNEKVVRYKTFSDLWRVLSLFEESGGEMSVSEVARSLDILPSKASRLLRAMEAGLLLERDAKTGRYRIGPRFLILGLHYLRTHPLRRTILPHLEQMSAELGVTSSWGIFRQGRVIIVDRLRPIGGQTVPLIGSEMPLHSSSYGKLFLAYLPEDEQDRILGTLTYDRFTPRTLTSPSALKSELQAVRARGYSIDREESAPNVIGISAPVFDESESMCAALTLAYTASRGDVDEARVLRYLSEKAVFISRQLGSSISPEHAPVIEPHPGADVEQ
ncbi:MAG: IclR family transcriptional regulator [Thermoleophilia bacterium]|nr:IclR family transcriptional regulator [Thermoleophilia bacterium]